MSERGPIELPALAAQRRGPCAAVCANGHLLSWFIDPDVAAKFCEKCGAAVLVACPACGAALAGDGEMLEWVPYHGNCNECGAAYPWKAADIERAKRTLTEQAELGGWSDELRVRAEQLVDDIAADRAMGSDVVTALGWIERRGGEGVTATMLDAVDRLGSSALKTALRPTFPGQF